ncbi:GumC family protein [Belliella marina]|uniref:non-specific protein-tyrosine kinase n=1 Tax=Belliella marina TaxID=1644146 RepID=A0ABW4VPI4_9BACT
MDNNNKNKVQDTSFNSTSINTDEISEFKSQIIRILRFWKIITVGMITGIIIAYIFNKSSPEVYQIESTILVGEEIPSLGMDLFEPMRFMQPKSNVENEIRILKSYPIIQKTIEELQLNVSYFKPSLFKKEILYDSIPIKVVIDWDHPQLIGGVFQVNPLNKNKFSLQVIEEPQHLYLPSDPGFLRPNEEPSGLDGKTFGFGEEISGINFKFKVQNIHMTESDPIHFLVEDTHGLVMRFKENTKVTTENKLASVITLIYLSPSRKLGEDYLNYLMSFYLEKELLEKNRAAENTVKFIDNQLAGITDSLSFFENRLQQFRSENRVFNLSQEGTMIFQRYLELEKQKSTIDLSFKYYTDLLEYLNRDQFENLISPSTVGLEDILLNTLVSNIMELQSEKSVLADYYSVNAPAIQEVNKKLESSKGYLLENVKSSIRNTQNSLLEINQKIKQVDAEINSLPQTEKQLVGLQRQFTINENIYLYLLQKRAESEISRASNMGKNSVLEYARTLDKPVSPRKGINLLIGAFSGFLFPFLIIFFRDYFKTTIEDPKALESSIDVPLLRTIGKSPEKDHLAVFNNPKSIISESFRSLRSDMSFLKPGYERLTILTTSAIPGEGKTFCSINLASVFSLLGKRTILIDLDLRKPKLAEHFGFRNDIGVSTCLSKNIPWKSAVKQTKYENLDLMLSGLIPPNPSELLGQESFYELIQEIKQSYDIVILDSPPIGVVSETLQMTPLADINLFVFRQNVSYKTNVHVLNNIVSKGAGQKFYAIMNDVSVDTNRGGYGYTYGYGVYEQYGMEKKKPSFFKSLFG